jgi:hypothetical protein
LFVCSIWLVGLPLYPVPGGDAKQVRQVDAKFSPRPPRRVESMSSSYTRQSDAKSNVAFFCLVNHKMLFMASQINIQLLTQNGKQQESIYKKQQHYFLSFPMLSGLNSILCNGIIVFSFKKRRTWPLDRLMHILIFISLLLFQF